MEKKEESIEDIKNTNNNNLTKSISLNNNSKKKIIENKDNKNQFLRERRKLYIKSTSQNPNINNKLSMSRSITHYFERTNIQNDNICIICLGTILFHQKHFLHCGHYFHCNCIKKWISMRKDKCPICKKNIKCIIDHSEESILNLEENENINRNYFNNIIRNINNNVNRNNNNNFEDWLTSFNDNLSYLYIFLMNFEVLILFFVFLFDNLKNLDKNILVWILLYSMFLLSELYKNI